MSFFLVKLPAVLGRIGLQLAIICIVLFVNQNPSIGQSADSKKIVLQCDRTEPTWWLGTEVVPIECTLKNQSNQVVRFLRLNNADYADIDLSVVLKDKTDKVISPDGPTISPPPMPAAKDFVELAPGKSYVFDFKSIGIGLRYENIKPGYYSIEVQLKVTDTQTKTKYVAASTCGIELRDAREYLIVKPGIEFSQVTQYPDGKEISKIGRVSIVERSPNSYWLVYLFELKADGKPEPSVFALHWLGNVTLGGGGARVKLEENGDALIEFQDVGGKKQYILIERFVGNSKPFAAKVPNPTRG